MSRGAVAAGHPLTAEAGVWALRQGGNAVDAAVAAVLASFAAESPLTGLGAGGYMLVHDDERSVVLDFFVAAPGQGGIERRAELIPADVYFTADVPQVFNIGAASCGVPGTAAGLEAAAQRFGSMPLAELARPAIEAARKGVEVSPMQGFLFQILEPILTHDVEGRRIYAASGRLLRTGERIHIPDLAGALELFAAEGAEPFYRGETARRISQWVIERGGTLAMEDLAAYEPIVREPVEARFQERRILTNPPPSSGGILIAYALELLERQEGRDIADLVAVMAEAQAERDEDFLTGLFDPGFAARFLSAERLESGAHHARERFSLLGGEGRGDALGSTTHLTAVDGEGRCATVTCSNGTGSGLVVPGTGVHVNNMLGEEDLNPLGFHRSTPGDRLPSMMSPTVILRGEELEAGLGSAGSNRIRSAIVQTVLRLVADGLDAQEAVAAPRVHFEEGRVQAEPGVADEPLRALEALGVPVDRWRERNLFFGGVQAVARDPSSGELTGGGDPRRGGAVVHA